MRLASIKWQNEEIAGIVLEKGIFPLRNLNLSLGTLWE